MTTLRQAAEQALEALKLIDNAMPFPVAKLTIKHLQEVLAEEPAQQEPAAWKWRCKPRCNWSEWIVSWPEWSVSLKRPVGSGADVYEDIPLYTSPSAQQEWVGLTDEEILQTLDLVAYDTQAFDFAYHIEAKLKEKNT